MNILFDKKEKIDNNSQHNDNKKRMANKNDSTKESLNINNSKSNLLKNNVYNNKEEQVSFTTNQKIKEYEINFIKKRKETNNNNNKENSISNVNQKEEKKSNEKKTYDINKKLINLKIILKNI